ncbi:hypothetical protein [Paracoccus sp. JM45]|uniref:hypothetical protein n=1 Tax=Paracoccus sp. JM45 TaxID=2283626 RepID=UPI000E6BC1F8|nr:hypothetical protein [Paracoccus sp. JM45]RJE79215.1 hypothetical protein DWB67_13520 [Paracoccus sp. JM45]
MTQLFRSILLLLFATAPAVAKPVAAGEKVVILPVSRHPAPVRQIPKDMRPVPYDQGAVLYPVAFERQGDSPAQYKLPFFRF